MCSQQSFPKCAWPRERLTSQQSQNHTCQQCTPLKERSVYPWSADACFHFSTYSTWCIQTSFLEVKVHHVQNQGYWDTCMLYAVCSSNSQTASFHPSTKDVSSGPCASVLKKHSVIRACNHSMLLPFFEFTPLSLKFSFLLSIRFFVPANLILCPADENKIYSIEQSHSPTTLHLHSAF